MAADGAGVAEATLQRRQLSLCFGRNQTLVYKLPHLTREEIKAMLTLEDMELKQTRFYQEIAEEKRQEGREEGRKEECIAVLTRLLRRKFGLQAELVSALQSLPGMEIEILEDLADAYGICRICR